MPHNPAPRGLRITFLLHFVISAVFGLQHMLVPRVWTDLGGMSVAETGTWRLIGAATLAFGVGSGMAWREWAWEHVRITAWMQIAWSALGAAVITWAIVYEGLPPLEWLNVALLAGFAVAFLTFTLPMRRRREPGT